MILNDKIDIQNESEAVKNQRIQNSKLDKEKVLKKERKGFCTSCSIF